MIKAGDWRWGGLRKAPPDGGRVTSDLNVAQIYATAKVVLIIYFLNGRVFASNTRAGDDEARSVLRLRSSFLFGDRFHPYFSVSPRKIKGMGKAASKQPYPRTHDVRHVMSP